MFPEPALSYVPELSFDSMLVNNELARIIDICTQSLLLIYGIKDSSEGCLSNHNCRASERLFASS